MRISTSSGRLEAIVVAKSRGVTFTCVRTAWTCSRVPRKAVKKARAPASAITPAATGKPMRSLEKACTIGMNATPVTSRAPTEPAWRNDASLARSPESWVITDPSEPYGTLVNE